MTASAATMWSMGPRRASETCTGVGASASASPPFSFLPQPDNAAARIARAARAALLRVAKGASRHVRSMVIASEIPRQNLEVGERDAIADLAVIGGVAGLGYSRLRVDDFQCGGFTRLIAQ